jgi:hypothetical protein
VQRLGVIAGQACQPRDRVAMDTDEPTGLANAAAFVQVFQQRQTYVVRKFRVEQRRTLAFAEPGLAGAAIQQTDALVFAKVAANGEVFEAALTVLATVRILTAEP